MERKPPSAPSWTKNWFTLQSRKRNQEEDEEGDLHELDNVAERKVYSYQMKWAVSRPPCPPSHVFSVQSIATMSLLQVPSDELLVYLEETGEAVLFEEIVENNYQENLMQYLEEGNMSWEHEDIADDEDCYPLRVHSYARSEEYLEMSVSPSHIVFCLRMYDGARHLLRTTKILKGLHWINSFAKAVGLAYEKESKEWNRETRITLNVKLRRTLEDSALANDGRDSRGKAKKEKFRRRRTALSPAVSPASTPKSPSTITTTNPNSKTTFRKPAPNYVQSSMSSTKPENKMPNGTYIESGADFACTSEESADRDTIPAEVKPMTVDASPRLDCIANLPSNVKPENRPQPEHLDREKLSTSAITEPDCLDNLDSSVSSLRNSHGISPGHYSRQVGSTTHGIRKTPTQGRLGPSHQGGDDLMARFVETFCFCFLLDDEDVHIKRNQERVKDGQTGREIIMNPINNRE